jgi:hypothetical protein
MRRINILVGTITIKDILDQNLKQKIIITILKKEFNFQKEMIKLKGFLF